jgi:crotonobetainyl-CoA:carnitine CoA-transferase CaiB-like acyl-CoA transferase
VSGERPLHGTRVLDLTRLLPGSYATLMLADLGADVLKLEDPRGGDHARQLPPLAGGTSAYFTVLNRNKRSMTLNLRAPEAAGILDRLVPSYDVVVDSFRPGTARRLGVDAGAMQRRNPRVICASITGFGQTGPYAERAAHDINYEALAGLLSLAGREPVVPGLLIGDIGAAYQATTQILAALFSRERTRAAAVTGVPEATASSGVPGVPGVIDVSIHDAALQWMVFPAARWLVDGAAEDPRQIPLRGEAAHYNVYETSDGRWLALGALEEKFWVAFCDRVGRPDLARLHDVPGEDQSRALAEVRALMRTRTRDEWQAHFADIDACLTPVYSLDEALSDPHVAARGGVIRQDGVTYIGSPPSAGEGVPGASLIRPAPSLGAHTDDVLETLGIQADERAALRARGVI